MFAWVSFKFFTFFRNYVLYFFCFYVYLVVYIHEYIRIIYIYFYFYCKTFIFIHWIDIARAPRQLRLTTNYNVCHIVYYVYSLYIEQSNSNRAISYFLLLSRSLSLPTSTIRLNSNSDAALLLCSALLSSCLNRFFAAALNFHTRFSYFLMNAGCFSATAPPSPALPLPPSLHQFHIRRHFLRSFSCPVRMCCLHTVTNSPIQPHTHTHTRTHTHT